MMQLPGLIKEQEAHFLGRAQRNQQYLLSIESGWRHTRRHTHIPLSCDTESHIIITNQELWNNDYNFFTKDYFYISLETE